MAVSDHGLEVLRKAGEEVTTGDKSDYFIKAMAKGLAPASYANIELQWNTSGEALGKVDKVIFKAQDNSTVKTLQFSYQVVNGSPKIVGIVPI